MRMASIIGKIIEKDRSASTSLEVYNSATLSASKALGRNDIGRLKEAAEADIIIINPRNLRYAPIADPIKSIVNAGTCDDVETVIVKSKKIIHDGEFVNINIEKLIEKTKRIAEDVWSKIPETDYDGRTIYEIGPRSLKIQ
jgi:cytosine/adenosine deaminase-related metal-dependent hydrolase